MVISLAVYILVLSLCSFSAQLKTEYNSSSSRLVPRTYGKLFAANDPRILDATAQFLTTLKKVAPAAEIRIATGGGVAVGHWFPNAGRTTEVCNNILSL